MSKFKHHQGGAQAYRNAPDQERIQEIRSKYIDDETDIKETDSSFTDPTN